MNVPIDGYLNQTGHGRGKLAEIDASFLRSSGECSIGTVRSDLLARRDCRPESDPAARDSEGSSRRTVFADKELSGVWTGCHGFGWY
jgi:hypothetical protein